ncbi:hypothetical protein BDN72DRAFT_838108 [Pluteus cervinus]|uniref:Uncharacterized protein n=1 Tax=Pluteus cervinus TaxID=181527 RepID=A0ACD3AZI3_9AGAR|nr:hypothetical protein BDN72DRAFT_838108 [Pluteus cervinus]
MAYRCSDFSDSLLVRALALANVLVYNTCTTLLDYRETFRDTGLVAERTDNSDLPLTVGSVTFDDASPVTMIDRGYTRKRRHTLTLEVNHHSNGAGYASTYFLLGGSGCGICDIPDETNPDIRDMTDPEDDVEEDEAHIVRDGMSTNFAPPQECETAEPTPSDWVVDATSTATHSSNDAGSGLTVVVGERVDARNGGLDQGAKQNTFLDPWRSTPGFTIDYYRLLTNLAYLQCYPGDAHGQMEQASLYGAIAPGVHPSSGLCVDGITYYSPFIPSIVRGGPPRPDSPTGGFDDADEKKKEGKPTGEGGVVGSGGSVEDPKPHEPSTTNIETTDIHVMPEGSTTGISIPQNKVLDEALPSKQPGFEQSQGEISNLLPPVTRRADLPVPEWRIKRAPSGKRPEEVFAPGSRLWFQNSQPPLSGNTFLGISHNNQQNTYSDAVRRGLVPTSGSTSVKLGRPLLGPVPAIGTPLNPSRSRGSFTFKTSTSKPWSRP